MGVWEQFDFKGVCEVNKENVAKLYNKVLIRFCVFIFFPTHLQFNYFCIFAILANYYIRLMLYTLIFAFCDFYTFQNILRLKIFSTEKHWYLFNLCKTTFSLKLSSPHQLSSVLLLLAFS